MRKIVLAYSGGLDTSVMLHWLYETYKCEIVTYTADLGQLKDGEVEEITQKAKQNFASKVIIDDVKKEFIENYAWKLLKANAIFEDEYLIGTISRYLMAKKLVKLAEQEGADCIVHGATGKGNDQVRIENSCKILNPNIEVLAPWRSWEFKSREDLINYAKEKGMHIKHTAEKPYSVDDNLWYVSHEGGTIEDLSKPMPNYDGFLELSDYPKNGKENGETVEIEFKLGVPVAVNGTKMDAVEIMRTLNKIGKENGIGLYDIMENRLVGMKSRGIYEFPAATILIKAHQMLESLVLERELQHYKKHISYQYGTLAYDAKWYTPLREALDAFVDYTQQVVNGKVILSLYKGNIFRQSIESPNSLYNSSIAGFTMGDDYNQKDVEGFMKIGTLMQKADSIINKKYGK